MEFPALSPGVASTTFRPRRKRDTARRAPSTRCYYGSPGDRSVENEHTETNGAPTAYQDVILYAPLWAEYRRRRRIPVAQRDAESRNPDPREATGVGYVVADSGQSAEPRLR